MLIRLIWAVIFPNFMKLGLQRLCFSREHRDDGFSFGAAVPDVLLEPDPPGGFTMARKACWVACGYASEVIKRHGLQAKITDPFCGAGLVLAAANHLRLDALGCDLSAERCCEGNRTEWARAGPSDPVPSATTPPSTVPAPAPAPVPAPAPAPAPARATAPAPAPAPASKTSQGGAAAAQSTPGSTENLARAGRRRMPSPPHTNNAVATAPPRRSLPSAGRSASTASGGGASRRRSSKTPEPTPPEELRTTVQRLVAKRHQQLRRSKLAGMDRAKALSEVMVAAAAVPDEDLVNQTGSPPSTKARSSYAPPPA